MSYDVTAVTVNVMVGCMYDELITLRMLYIKPQPEAVGGASPRQPQSKNVYGGID